MNETINSMIKRRTIRKYKQEQITDGELNAVLEAGLYAPSGANQQSAVFIVVQNKDVIKKLTKMNAEFFGKDIDTYYGAPTIVLVLADKNKRTPVEDGSLALGNMYNAAYSLGLGACWVHREKQMFESEEGLALLKEWGVEGDFIGVGALTLGYPDCELPAPSSRNDNRVFFVK